MGCPEFEANLQQKPCQIRQVLLVTLIQDQGFFAELTAWEIVAGEWRQALAVMPAVIGQNGFIGKADKREGDGCTPYGVYALKRTFGSVPAINTKMPYYQTSADDYWVDDPASPEYNQWVKGSQPQGSFERMLRPNGLYRYGIVIEYNTEPVVPGKGSAIFIHPWQSARQPTRGCVALSEDNLIQLLSWLEPEKNPAIILGKTEA